MAVNPITWMLVVGGAGWGALTFGFGSQAAGAVLFGLLAPLAAAVVTWLIVASVHGRSPERVSPAMIRLFGAKLVLFGAYVAAVVWLVRPETVPFVVSFTAHYIVLHVMEALYLRRLFSGDRRMAVN